MHAPETRTDRPSDAPLAIELTGSASLPSGGWASNLTSRIPPSWLGMSGYLAAGVFLGLILILALSLGRGNNASAATAAAASNAVTDNVVRLHARDIGESCWRDANRDGPSRVTVSLEVGVDGRVRYAIASGASPSMRGCVEAHVKAWEFLPQAQAQTMALPVEIDRR